MKYTNPRSEAEIPDWPIGRQRTIARFNVERRAVHGERVARMLLLGKGAHTQWSKPKRTTYASRWAIVTGEDGYPYLLGLTATTDTVAIVSGTMVALGHVFNDNPMHGELVALIRSVPKT